MELLAFADNKLTTQTRTVFRLRFDKQLSYKAIAEQVGISEAAVYKHLIQAIRKMKEQFNPNQKWKKIGYGQMERLLDMMEHSDQYTDEQLNELLRDDELRQTVSAYIRHYQCIWVQKDFR